jgi:hypothetical protein
MDFKEWLKPRVLISGGAGLALAFLISWLLLTKSLVSVPCQPSGSMLLISLSSTSGSFSTVACAGQVVRWTSAEQLTVKFHPNKICTDKPKYPLNQTCVDNSTTPPTTLNCSQPVTVKQPSSIIGWCDYDVVGGLQDPRVIIIGQ